MQLICSGPYIRQKTPVSVAYFNPDAVFHTILQSRPRRNLYDVYEGIYKVILQTIIGSSSYSTNVATRNGKPYIDALFFDPVSFTVSILQSFLDFIETRHNTTLVYFYTDPNKLESYLSELPSEHIETLNRYIVLPKMTRGSDDLSSGASSQTAHFPEDIADSIITYIMSTAAAVVVPPKKESKAEVWWLTSAKEENDDEEEVPLVSTSSEAGHVQPTRETMSAEARTAQPDIETGLWVNLPEGAVNALAQIMRHRGSTDIGDALLQAIADEEVLAEELARGSKILVERHNRNIFELIPR